MSVSPAHVFAHHFCDCFVVWVVAVADHETFYAGEMTFDSVHPGSVGRGVNQLDVVCFAPVDDFFLLVRRQVVQHQVNSSAVGITTTDHTKETQDVLPAFPLGRTHRQVVGMHVVSAEVVSHAVGARVSRPMTDRMLLPSPGASRLRTHLDGPEFIETDYRRSFRRFAVERLDSFFLAS